MVFQHLALFPYKNVYQNLTFGLKMQGVSGTERRERASGMLSVLDLQDYGDNGIDELSGGEQQRVALGRSLLPEPDVLLLDEPSASLDVKLRKEMQLELRRIHNNLQSTFFYVTHDQ
jgi:ABC-type Fe3+/spermidine/putrescine transport system ATPase subunit